MSIAIHIGDLNMSVLSAKAQAHVSEYALVLYRLDGAVFYVDSDDILSPVFTLTKRSTDTRLLAIYHSLRAELSDNIDKLICKGEGILLNRLHRGRTS